MFCFTDSCSVFFFDARCFNRSSATFSSIVLLLAGLVSVPAQITVLIKCLYGSSDSLEFCPLTVRWCKEKNPFPPNYGIDYAGWQQ